MNTEAEEANAIETLDGAEWMGRELRVNKARFCEDSKTNSVASGSYSSDDSLSRNY
jgi:RNA recognition motif-containing protein